MRTFEVGKEYIGKTIFNEYKLTCVRRTEKTATFVFEYDDDEELTKRIKCESTCEYIDFSKGFMGFTEMRVRA